MQEIELFNFYVNALLITKKCKKKIFYLQHIINTKLCKRTSALTKLSIITISVR
jgi:hypothetical protein